MSFANLFQPAENRPLILFTTNPTFDSPNFFLSKTFSPRVHYRFVGFIKVGMNCKQVVFNSVQYIENILIQVIKKMNSIEKNIITP